MTTAFATATTAAFRAVIHVWEQAHALRAAIDAQLAEAMHGQGLLVREPHERMGNDGSQTVQTALLWQYRITVHNRRGAPTRLGWLYLHVRIVPVDAASTDLVEPYLSIEFDTENDPEEFEIHELEDHLTWSHQDDVATFGAEHFPLATLGRFVCREAGEAAWWSAAVVPLDAFTGGVDLRRQLLDPIAAMVAWSKRQKS